MDTAQPPRPQFALAMSKSLINALNDNPFAIAGLADWDDADDAKFQEAMCKLAGAVRSGTALPLPRHYLIYALVRVAQEEYGAHGHEYWQTLANRLGVPPLQQWQQDLFGQRFREAVQYFDYSIPKIGRKNIEPILWHAGCPRNTLPKLIQFVRDQVDIYGDRATEPDAIHALRLGEAAKQRVPPLHATIKRLFSSNPEGMEQIWSALANVVNAFRRGGVQEARSTWDPLPGIELDDVLQQLNDVAADSGVEVSVRRPRLRYNEDSGELILWVTDGPLDEWEVSGLKTNPVGFGWNVLPPLPERFTLRHRKTGQTWDESLLVDRDRPSVWFDGRSGALERGDAIAARGLSAGRWLVLISGKNVELPKERCLPLELSYLKGGEAWSAWEVEVPARIVGAEPAPHVIRVDGQDWKFALARGLVSSVQLVDVPVVAGQTVEGRRLMVFARTPTLTHPAKAMTGRLLRIREGGADIVANDVPLGGRLPEYGPGVYRLIPSRGSARPLVEYAVIPGFTVSELLQWGGEACVRVTADSSGSFLDATERSGEWSIRQSNVHPWLRATWRWVNGTSPDVQMRWPVYALRWRIEAEDEDASWTRDSLIVDRRKAAGEKTRIEVETQEPNGLLLNGTAWPEEKMRRTPSGWRFELKPDAFTSVDELTIETCGEKRTIAWLTELPVLQDWEAVAEQNRLLICWKAEHLPRFLCVQVWDPEAAMKPPLSVSIDSLDLRDDVVEIPIAIDEGGSGWLSVAFGSEVGQGFSRTFRPGRYVDGGRTLKLVRWYDKPRCTQRWAQVLHRWSTQVRFDRAPIHGVVHDLNQLEKELDWAEVRAYYDALCAPDASTAWLPLRNELKAAFPFLWRTAAHELANSKTPSTVVRSWLTVGVHPGWCCGQLLAEEPDDGTGYPANYIRALATLNAYKLDEDTRRDAAFDVWGFHQGHELFSPISALPFEKARSYGGGSLRPTSSDQCHRHSFLPKQENRVHDDKYFVNLAVGFDLYVELIADVDDHTPTTAAQSLSTAGPGQGGRYSIRAVSYDDTKYDAGWHFKKDCWELGRFMWNDKVKKTTSRQCCNLRGPLLVRGWLPEKLFQHLRMENWLKRDQIQKLRPTLPPLPTQFDNFLCDGELGIVHRHILAPPARKAQMLWGVQLPATPERSEYPLAARIAWRLAWLDRTGFVLDDNGVPKPHPAIADWTPFFESMSDALNVGGAFSELLISCLGIAEYMKAILGGGLGPAFRFDVPPRRIPL